MKPRRLRWRSLTPDSVLGILFDASDGTRSRPVIVPGTIARCSAPADYRVVCERLGYCHPFSGTRHRYCSCFPTDCHWQREEWQSGPAVELAPAPKRRGYSQDERTTAIRTAILAHLLDLAGDDTRNGHTAACYLGLEEWPHAKRKSLVRHREAQQRAMASEIIRRIDAARPWENE